MPDAAVLSSGDASAEQVAKFVARWQASEAAERANYQLFLSELCGLLGVAQPEPAWEHWPAPRLKRALAMRQAGSSVLQQRLVSCRQTV